MKRAVLIGVNKYRDPDVNDLRGCVNDVKAIVSLLVEEYGFAPENIRKLVRDPDNTRKGILAALKELEAATGTDDVVVVYYSGHGSQVPDESNDPEDGGWDETIVPADSGRSGRRVRDILDDELHGHLTALAEKTDGCTFIFDSCHSGSVDRFLLQQGSELTTPGVTIRATPPADSRPDEAPSEAADPASRTAIAVGNSAASPQRYLKVAACLDEQTAGERRFGNAIGGIFTHHLVAALRADSSQPFATAFETVRKKLKPEGQNPVFDGPLDAKRAAPFGGSEKVAALTEEGDEEEDEPKPTEPEKPDEPVDPNTEEDGEGGADGDSKTEVPLLEWDPEFARAVGVALLAALVGLGLLFFCSTGNELDGEDASVRFSGMFAIAVVVSGLALALTGAYAALLGVRGRSRKTLPTLTVSGTEGQPEGRRALSVDKALEAGSKFIEAFSKLSNARALILVGALLIGGGIAFVWDTFPTTSDEEAPEIVRQPESVTRKAGGSAFFWIVATSEDDSLAYEWRRNGEAIPAGKGSYRIKEETLSIPKLTKAMNGDTITAVVSDDFGQKTVSEDAKLTVKLKK